MLLWVVAHDQCVVTQLIKWALIASAVPGACTSCAPALPAGDQLALVEFTEAGHTATALSLNGMKLGDTHIIQVGRAADVAYERSRNRNTRRRCNMQLRC